MSLDVARRALDLAFAQASSRGHWLVRLSWFGGEPLLEPDLIDATAREATARARAQRKLLRMGLTTNGTLLDDRRLEVLARHKVQLTVSLDGTQAAHDAARVNAAGRGSWADAVAGLRRAQEAMARAGGPEVRVLAVVHPGNVRWLGESFAFLASLGARYLLLSLDSHADWGSAGAGSAASGQRGVGAGAWGHLERGMAAVRDGMLAAFRRGEALRVEPLHGKILTHLLSDFASASQPSGCDLADRCGFGVGELAVAPSGRLYPCDRLVGEDGPAEASLCIGDVNRPPGQQVDWDRVTALRHAKNRGDPACEACPLRARCAWACGCANHAATGRIDRPGALVCRYEQLVIREADRLAATLYAEGNTAFLGHFYRDVGRPAPAPEPTA